MRLAVTPVGSAARQLRLSAKDVRHEVDIRALDDTDARTKLSSHRLDVFEGGRFQSIHIHRCSLLLVWTVDAPAKHTLKALKDFGLAGAARLADANFR